MIPQGLRTAWRNCATFRPRPARSGPKAPSPLVPWQFLQAVALGATRSQYAFPAWALPWAAAMVGASGSISNATISFFMRGPPDRAPALVQGLPGSSLDAFQRPENYLRGTKSAAASRPGVAEFYGLLPSTCTARGVGSNQEDCHGESQDAASCRDRVVGRCRPARYRARAAVSRSGYAQRD